MARKSIIALVALVSLSLGYVLITDAMPVREIPQVLKHLFSPGASASITVLNQPLVGMYAPTGLTVRYVNKSDVNVSWVKDTYFNTLNTEIVVNYNHYPTTRTDGYVLYDGTGSTFDDLSVNLDEYWGTYYVSAWSQDTVGNWTTDYATAKYEVDMAALVAEMQTWLLFALLVALNAAVFWKADKRKFLWVLGFCVDVASGLLFAATAVEYSMTWILGLVIAILGLYFLTEFALWALGIKKKTPRNEDKDD